MDTTTNPVAEVVRGVDRDPAYLTYRYDPTGRRRPVPDQLAARVLGVRDSAVGALRALLEARRYDDFFAAEPWVGALVTGGYLPPPAAGVFTLVRAWLTLGPQFRHRDEPVRLLDRACQGSLGHPEDARCPAGWSLWPAVKE